MATIRPPWMMQSRGRINASPTMAKTGADFVRENGGLAPNTSGAFGGLNEFYRSQVTPSSFDRLQHQRISEQEAGGGFYGEDTQRGNQVASFAAPPAPVRLPLPPGGFTEGQKATDAQGNSWTFDAKLGKGVMDTNTSAAPPAPVGGVNIGQAVEIPDRRGIGFAAPPRIAPGGGAGFPAPASSTIPPSGTLDTDFMTRGIKREMTNDPKYAYGVMRDTKHDAQAVANAEAEAQRWQTTQNNISARAEKQRDLTKEIATANREGIDRRAQENRAFQMQQDQAKVAQKAIEKENDLKVKTATEHEGQTGRIKAMSEVGYLDKETAAMIEKQPPALQKGFLDVIEKARKDAPEETKIQDIGGYQVKTGPGTIIKEPKDMNTLSLKEQKADYYRLLEMRSKFSDDPEALKDIDADIAVARAAIRGAQPQASASSSTPEKPKLSVREQLLDAKSAIK